MLGLIARGSSEDDVLRINIGDASSTELDYDFNGDVSSSSNEEIKTE